jgi:cytochrome bd ubiquinol oxidase subunit II
MDLNTVWFVLIVVLFCGFFFLEGFDYGVCILMPFLGKNDKDRRILINSIGPVWDGNEVWLLTAGGAIFAAFPNWYATMFSGFYLPLFLILLALIFRGVGIEFRSKMPGKTWRKTWDIILFLGSLIPALLFGVALANLLKGVPIDAHMEYTGGFFNLISPYTLVAGVAALSFFMYHGAVYISLKTKGELMEKAKKLSTKLGAVTLGLWVLLGILTYFQTDLFKNGLAIIFLLLAGILLVASLLLMGKGKNGKAMLVNGFTVVSAVAALFCGLFPRVMVSSINKNFDLTITNAASSHYTLNVMTIIALTLVPIVLLYQGYTYWVFRKRISSKNLEY